MTETNPLLRIPFEVPFNRIGARDVEPAIAELIADAERRLDAIVRERGPRTFSNTMAAFDSLTERLDIALTIVGHLESVATTPELREAYGAVQASTSAFYSGIPTSSGLWMALQSFAATDEAKALSPTHARFLNKTIAAFRRHGAELDSAGKKRLSEIDVELAQATLQFSQNVLDSTNSYEWILTDAKQLRGLPDSAVEAARASAEAKGLVGYRFTLQAPSLIAVLTYADDARLREAMARANGARGAAEPFDNRPIVKRILQLRAEKAQLLRFPDFVSLVTDERMVKTAERAKEFIADLRAKTTPFFERENKALIDFRRKIEGDDAPPLQSWDVAYYAERLRLAEYDFDEEELRPYFELNRVMAGMFEVASRIYGIQITPWPGAPVWHESVQSWAIRDSDGSVLGAFYVDLFPRESKRDGAWMEGIITGHPGGDKRHLGVFCGNFTPSVDGAPALLTHREVATLFHEFGHLLHHCLTRVDVRSLAGTRVVEDFVELPSQMMENWCWEREALDLFARHHDSGAPIPEALFAKLTRARSFRAANAMMRQLGFASLDLALHSDFDSSSDGDPIAYAREILALHAPTPLPADHAMAASFSHLFSSPVGYAGGYYSYKWAEVLEADAFNEFSRAGVLSHDVGMRFRRSVLERGDSEDADVLFRDFAGRSPSVDALFRRAGLC